MAVLRYYLFKVTLIQAKIKKKPLQNIKKSITFTKKNFAKNITEEQKNTKKSKIRAK